MKIFEKRKLRRNGPGLMDYLTVPVVAAILYTGLIAPFLPEPSDKAYHLLKSYLDNHYGLEGISFWITTFFYTWAAVFLVLVAFSIVILIFRPFVEKHNEKLEQ